MLSSEIRIDPESEQKKYVLNSHSDDFSTKD